MKNFLEIKIKTSDRNLLCEIFGKNVVTRNEEIKIPNSEAIIKYIHYPSKGFNETITLVLTFGGGIITSIVANWIYDKLKGRASEITIDRTLIKIDKNQIKKVIDEKINIK